MKRFFLLIMAFGLTASLLHSCSEVEEVGEFDNWQGRNEAYIDSLSAATGDRRVPFTGSGSMVDAYPVGQLFALQSYASTAASEQYVYCKKLSENPDGARPLYTESASVYYYGTFINGNRFDGNFEGYSATDRGTLDADVKAPTEFDAPITFSVASSGLVSGWTTVLQYMREGERWMVYIPWQSAYGDTDYNGIPAFSTLVFDIVLDEVVKD